MCVTPYEEGYQAAQNDCSLEPDDWARCPAEYWETNNALAWRKGYADGRRLSGGSFHGDR